MVEENTEKVKVHLQWAGDFVTEHELIRPVARYEQLSCYRELLDLIEKLHKQRKTFAEIADDLNRDGWQPPKRRTTFNKGIVQTLYYRRHPPSHRPPATERKALLKQHEWWLGDFSRETKIPQPTLHNWIKRGWIASRQLQGPHGYRVIWADKSEIKRLHRLRTRKRGWTDEVIPAELTTPKKSC